MDLVLGVQLTFWLTNKLIDLVSVECVLSFVMMRIVISATYHPFQRLANPIVQNAIHQILQSFKSECTPDHQLHYFLSCRHILPQIFVYKHIIFLMRPDSWLCSVI